MPFIHGLIRVKYYYLIWLILGGQKWVQEHKQDNDR